MVEGKLEVIRNAGSGNMIEDGAVRPEGCIFELHSDISHDWRNIRTRFGYNMLAEMQPHKLILFVF